MAKQPESLIVKKILKALRKRGGWWFKMWGGPFTPAGIPDIIGCIEGYFFALEVKRPISSSQPSEIQLATISDIVWKGGGTATVVRSPEEALYVVNTALAEAARGFRVWKGPRSPRSVLRAANREDLYNDQATPAQKPVGGRAPLRRANRSAK